MYKLLDIYKTELNLRNTMYKYFRWRLILPHLFLFAISLLAAIIFSIAFKHPSYFSVVMLPMIVFPDLLKKMERERDRILRDVHNCSSFSSLRLRRVRKFLKDESIDHSNEKMELLIKLVDKQADEKRVPFLVGRGVLAVFLVPIWIQSIAWILNKQIETVNLFIVFISILAIILILISVFIYLWKTIIHDEIINSDFNRLKIISSDLSEILFKYF